MASVNPCNNFLIFCYAKNIRKLLHGLVIIFSLYMCVRFNLSKLQRETQQVHLQRRLFGRMLLAKLFTKICQLKGVLSVNANKSSGY